MATERVAASGARPGPEAFDAGALAGAHVIAGTLDGGEIRLGIAVSRFNGEVTTRLLAGARSACERHGIAAEAVSVAVVPGAFELPLAAQALAHSGVDAVVCLGAVIRGETTHYDLVAGEAAAGCQRVQLDTGCRWSSASSRPRTWTRRSPAPAASSATRARRRSTPRSR